MKTPNLFVKISAATVMSAFLMSATNCQQEETPLAPARPKRIVEIGKISAKPVVLPNGQTFDLEFVVNQQFPHIMVGSDQYSLINRNLFKSNNESALTPEDHQLISKVGPIAEKWHLSKEAECLVNMPQFKIGGDITSYEWVSGGGLRVGYTPAGNSTVTGVNGEVHFDKAEMDLQLGAFESIDGSLLQTATITKDQLKTKVSFNISFGLISIGPEFYHQKGLAQVTKEALELAIEKLRKKTDTVEWFTRVGYREENFLTIVGGQNVNLKVGDIVTIHNAKYFWEDGRVCQPDAYQGLLNGEAIAEGEIIEVTNKISAVKINQGTIGAEDPLTGSVVKIKRLVDQK